MNCCVERVIGGPDRSPSSPYILLAFTQVESVLKLANRKVVAFFVLLKFGDSTESSLTVLASKSSKEQCSSGPRLF